MPLFDMACFAATCFTTRLGEVLLQSRLTCAWYHIHTGLKLIGALSGALLLLAPLQELLHILVLQSTAPVRQAVSSIASRCIAQRHQHTVVQTA